MMPVSLLQVVEGRRPMPTLNLWLTLLYGVIVFNMTTTL